MSKPTVELEVALAALQASQAKLLKMVMPNGEQGGMVPILMGVDVALWSIAHNIMLSQLLAAMQNEMEGLKRMLLEKAGQP